ncbi:hypothetical protein JTB14_038126 [Gonioctena quinquepunctata]|nr:hypothetical protein JTB14_038126 [Gonioctena quinquepunctata]
MNHIQITVGHSVMGMVNHGALANFTIVDRHLTWRIPDDWSLADAASVPVVYGTVVYALTVRGRMKHGDSILIHSGTGGVGQAAIRYALFHGCTVYTTVSNQQKAEYLMKLFPQLTDKNIGNSRDQSFVKMIMRRTRGRGVDMVLNSLSEDKLLASVRCLARGGRFLEIGKYDLVSNNSLNLTLMNKEASFHGVVLDALFDKQPLEKELLGQLVMKGIKDGSIKPLGCTIFKRNEIEEAYRYMTKGIHMGKVLIQVCEEEAMRSDISEIEATPRFYCDPAKTFIIIGGLGGLGLELADWMVLRGARKLVLTSRGGLKNGYQRFRIKFWRRYGVVVKISTANITQREGCVQLISEAEKIGPVAGIFNLAVILQDAMLENQNAAMFETSLGPKAYATKYLDEVSRSSCPELSEFVVFSSVSCGRGNPGQTNYGMANSVMERICEQRSRDGLPALVIQWGAVGEVGLVAEMREGHKELEISGTLQQRVSSCMEVMDLFLRQKSTTIVSSMVVAEKKNISNKASLTSTVLGIIGIMDDKLVSTQTTLAELGMDSMNGVEIRQVLEREFDMILSSRELRTLTYGRLLELECKRNSQITDQRVTEVDIHLKDLMAILLPNELGDQDSIIEMGGIVTGDQVPIVYFIAGIEGYSKSMQPLAQMLNARIFGLQYDYNNPSEDIVEMAQSYIPHMEQNLSKEKSFCIVAHSCGVNIGVEVVAILESKGYKGTLIAIDGAPNRLIDAMKRLPDDSEEIFELTIIREITDKYASSDILNGIVSELIENTPLDERIEHVLDIVKDAVPYSREFLKKTYIGLIKRMKAIKKHNPSSISGSEVVLLKASAGLMNGVELDGELSKICGKSVEVSTFEGNHLTVLKNVDLAKKINSLL